MEEKMIKKVLGYLNHAKNYEGRKLSESIMIYYSYKRYYIDDLDNIIIEDLTDDDYFEEWDKSKIIVSMDGILSEYIHDSYYKYDKIIKRLNNILNKYGYNYDLGSTWWMTFIKF